MKIQIISLVLALGLGSSASLPEPSASKLPHWRGFNMQNLFWEGERNVPFEESNFRMISEMGGNFIRIPVTYKLITQPGDFRTINPELLKPLEQAMAWGKKYDLHICLNLFQVPGHCITKENDPRWPAEWDLWRDEEAQDVFSNYWKFLAERYKDIPNRYLSFNLINEPHWHVSEEAYAKVMKLAIDAVRSEDPDRLMVVDGLKAASAPCWALVDEGVAQALHFYKPMALTHYKADWMENPPDRIPESWPLPLISKHLYGPRHKFSKPFVIKGGFGSVHKLIVQVGDVVGSDAMPLELRVTADGKPILEKVFTPDSGRFHKKPGVFEFTQDEDFTIEIPRGKKRIEIEVADGDRLTLRGVVLENMKSGKRTEIIPVVSEWGSTQAELTYDPASGIQADEYLDRDWLFEKYLKPFQALEEKGVGVMAMEFGCYNQTPHPLVLGWMDDCLDMFSETGWGWALWEWKGPFGPISSERPDVDYVEHEGMSVDKAMLKLLGKQVKE